jgi:general secretion pathway protein K
VNSQPTLRPGRAQQRGAALLTAMVIVTLVATMSASMVWQQWRAVQVETAERARTQSAWILSGALDWARLILREDLRSGSQIDHLGEPWAVPLAEARLSTFLAADKDQTDDGPEAFLSGRINDVQARLNLHNLVGVQQGKLAIDPAQLLVFENLCDMVGVSKATADQLANGLLNATPPVAASPTASAAVSSNQNSSADTPLMPKTFAELAWLGIDPAALRRLKPYVTMLPVNTKVNANTAPPEVLAAALGTDLATAQRLIEVRQHKPFEQTTDMGPYLGNPKLLEAANVGLNSDFFEVHGRLRLGTRVLEEVSLVERQGRNVIVVRRERVNLVDQ